MRDDRAVSPVIGTLLILATFTVVVTTVITVGRPQIVEYQERGEFQSVVNQFNKIANEASQLTISGNTNEVRQPTLKLPRGDLVVERGHHVALSVGYFAGNYSDVPGHAVTPGHHPGFFVRAADLSGLSPPGPDFGPDWDAMDQAIELVYVDEAYASTDRTVYTRLAKWTGADWSHTFTDASSTVRSGDALRPVPFIDEKTLLANLTDGPWRIRVYHDVIGTDVLIGEVYIYDLTRLKYHYSGESGPRSAFLENGAVIVTEHNQHRIVRQGLMAAPSEGFGGTTLTARASVLDESTGAAGGRTDVGILMRVIDVEDWVSRGGAANMRLQFSGLYPALWYDHLDDNGFLADPDPARGVYYVDARATPGSHSAFPVNVIYTEIDMRFRPR